MAVSSLLGRRAYLLEDAAGVCGLALNSIMIQGKGNLVPIRYPTYQQSSRPYSSSNAKSAIVEVPLTSFVPLILHAVFVSTDLHLGHFCCDYDLESVIICQFWSVAVFLCLDSFSHLKPHEP